MNNKSAEHLIFPGLILKVYVLTIWHLNYLGSAMWESENKHCQTQTDITHTEVSLLCDRRSNAWLLWLSSAIADSYSVSNSAALGTCPKSFNYSTVL